MEIQYIQNGDYLIPALTLEEKAEKPLTKWGRMRRVFLRENRPMFYSDLVLTGKLYPHVLEIQEAAQTRMEQMMDGMLKSFPAPDKKADQMAWVRHMNALKTQAEERVMEELINS